MSSLPYPNRDEAYMAQAEQDFLDSYSMQDFPPFALTADVLLIAPSPSADPSPLFLLIKRAGFPFKGKYALPGGFLSPDESLERCASRELEEETNLFFPDKMMRQLGTFSAPGRDPRGNIISTLFLAVAPHAPSVGPTDETDGAVWVSFDRFMQLADAGEIAFDHAEMVMSSFPSDDDLSAMGLG